MNKVLASLLMIGVVAAMAGAGTFALFQDTETSMGNTFTAGVIDLAIDCDGDTIFDAQDDPLPEIFYYMPTNDIKPGDSGEVTLSLHLKEDSNNADLWMEILNIVNNGGVLSEPEQEAEAGEIDDIISDEILVTIWLDDGDNIYDISAGDSMLYDGVTLTSLKDVKIPVQQSAVAGTTYYVGFSWELPSTVGNEHQGDQCTFDIKFGADQITV